MGKIFVTGAGGFVGSALCEALRCRGFSYIGSRRRGGATDCIEVGDINGNTEWSSILAGCDTVIHLAGRVHVMNDIVADPLSAFRRANVDATANLARQAAQGGVRRFVFVSSVKVNGESTVDKPFTAVDPVSPRDPYGQSKFEAELALEEVARTTGLEVVIVRPPLVYGPNVRANFLKLMQLVKLGIPLPLGAVHNRRSMVAIGNLVDFLITCATHSSAAGKRFMVSDDNDVSTSKLLIWIAEAMGRRPLLIPVPVNLLATSAALLGQSAAMSRLLGSLQIDIAETKSILGWKPVVGVQEAIKETVLHFLR